MRQTVPALSTTQINSIETMAKVAANISVSNSTNLLSTGLLVPIVANTAYKIIVWMPFTLVGVASGFKFAIAGPASPTNFIASFNVITSAATLLTSTITTLGNSFASALATAATHNCLIEATLENGANAGNIDVQFSQNVSDASAITILRGARVSVAAIS